MNVYTGEKKHNIQSPEDRDSIIYQKGFSAGTEHSRSSPETIKKITQMSEDITNLKVGMQEIKGDVKVVSSDIKNLTELLKSHIAEENENKKAHEKVLETKADKILVDDLRDNQKWTIRTIIALVVSLFTAWISWVTFK